MQLTKQYRRLQADCARLKRQLEAVHDARFSSFARIYGSIDGGRVECPACRRLILFGIGPGNPHRKHWNRSLSAINCAYCNSTFYVGLLLWKTGPGRLKAPPDTVPNRRQLAEIHRAFDSFWVRTPRRTNTPVNLYRDDPPREE